MVNKETFAWLMLIAAGLVDTVSMTILKVQFNYFGEINISSASAVIDYSMRFFQSPYVLASVAVITFSPLLNLIALSRLQLSRAYPVLAALHLFLIQSFSILLLQEPFSVKKAIGLCLLLLSIFIVYSEKVEN
jgi:multidrug transporter EmrE-like cation transporter